MIIEITDLLLAPPAMTMRYTSNRLIVGRGDVIVIVSDPPTDGRYLLRVLATLAPPERGEYRFNGTRVDINDYRQCLAVKRRIGYVAPDAAMISNRTIRENLLLSRLYSENDPTIDIDKAMLSLCRAAGLTHKLARRPSVLSNQALQKAITIREIGKQPTVMLIDRPENFIENMETDMIFGHLKEMARSGTAMVFISRNRHMADLANRQLTLAGGKIQASAVNRSQ